MYINTSVSSVKNSNAREKILISAATVDLKYDFLCINTEGWVDLLTN